MPYKYGFNSVGRVFVLKTGRFASRKAAKGFVRREFVKVVKQEARRVAALPRCVRVSFGTGVSANKQSGAIKLEYQEVVKEGDEGQALVRGMSRLKELAYDTLGWNLDYFPGFSPDNFNWGEPSAADCADAGKWRSKVVYKGKEHVVDGG